MDSNNFSRAQIPDSHNLPIERLFLCHAVFGPVKADLINLTGENFEKAIRTNCTSHFVIIKQLLSNLKAAKNPKVVMLISKGGIHADITGKPSIAYRVSKSAQIALGLAIRETLEELGIELLLVNPGWVKTKIGGKKAPLSPLQSAKQVVFQVENYEPSTLKNKHILNFNGSTETL